MCVHLIILYLKVFPHAGKLRRPGDASSFIATPHICSPEMFSVILFLIYRMFDGWIVYSQVGRLKN